MMSTLYTIKESNLRGRVGDEEDLVILRLILVVSRAIKWQIRFLRFFGIQFKSYLDLYFGKFFYSM